MTAEQKPLERPSPRSRSVDFKNLSDDALVRERDVLQVLPYSAATFWRRVNSGGFPKPIRLDGRVTCWRWGDVREWLRSQVEKAA